MSVAEGLTAEVLAALLEPEERAEGHLKVRGVARYAADATQPGMLWSATLYSSMEPCGQRASRPLTCTELIIKAGIPRVVFAEREPLTFVDGKGFEQLTAAGVEVVELPEVLLRLP